MKACLIGCGGISKCHFAAIQKLSERGAALAAAADIIPERAQAAAAEYGCEAYTDYRQMLREQKPDVVHICTPHDLHVEMAVYALERGIHVVLEKPCAISLEGLRRLEAAEQASAAKLAVCFQNRYNEAALHLKGLIESGKYGGVEGVDVIVKWQRDEPYYNADQWHGTKAHEGGGVMINQAIHSHDLMKFISGKETEAVEGHIANYHLKETIDVEDMACAYFTFTDGTRGVYYATTASARSTNPIMEFHLTQATLRLEGGYVFEIHGDQMALIYSQKTQDVHVGKTEWGTGHYKLIRDFYDCIAGGRPFELSAREAGKAVVDLLAVYASSAQNRPVSIKEFRNGA